MPDSERRKRLISVLQDTHLDALICTAASDVLLLTGYWPVMAMSIATLTVNGDCTIILPEDEAAIARISSTDSLKLFSPVKLTSFEPIERRLQDLLGEEVQRAGFQQARIGIRERVTEQPAPYVVATAFHDTLRTLLNRVAPHAYLQACDDLLDEQRSAVTPGELLQLEKASAIVEQGFAVAAEAIEPGLREVEVAARIQMAFDTAFAAQQVHRSYGMFFCMSGPNSATASAAYARTRERRLETGDLVMIHANTCADGFWTDVTRTYTVGPASARQKAMRTAIMEARLAGLARVAPQVRASDVDYAVRSVMKQHGFGEAFVHPTGHGVGFAAANSAARPRIHPLSPDVLREGSTFNLEPAAYFEGYGGMRHCDVVVVTATGGRALTEF